ncbi:MAG: hypothetical protein EXQ94_07030 [Alphaproteobacteria bacterium]|nr:hypothetical protein [Alphaproteobacteria bacterium]
MSVVAGFHADPALSFTLPARTYTDPAQYQRERQEIFGRSWLYAGHGGVARARLGPLGFANEDPAAPPFATVLGDLEREVRAYCPELDRLVFSRRVSYEVRGNWKNSVDNFLECYHCHVAHSDFCDLVDMTTYRSICHRYYSSHCGRSRGTSSRAYSYAQRDRATDFGSWFLWPNLCLEVFPGAPNLNTFHHVPTGPETTRHVFDFFFENPTPTPEQESAIRYIDQVLQVEDIALVESVQRGLHSLGYNQGRFIVDPGRTDMSEHAVHHFHALVVAALAGAD